MATPTKTSRDELIHLVRVRIDEMSSGHRQVAEFIIDHYDRAAFLTAAKLGAVVGVSESTVIRFAMSLGYAGYPELQKVLQDVVRSRLTTVDRLLGAAGGMDTQDDTLTAIMQADLENIRLTLRDLDRAAFGHAVELLGGARRILVVGFRSAASLALFLGFNLNWVLGNVKVAGFTAQDLWEDLVHLGPEDVVLGITFPRYTRATVQALAAARKRGCRIVALTDSPVSPISKHADVVLAARSSIPAYVDSFVAPLSVVNALLAAVSTLDKARTTGALRRLEDLWAEHEIYDKAGGR